MQNIAQDVPTPSDPAALDNNVVEGLLNNFADGFEKLGCIPRQVILRLLQ